MSATKLQAVRKQLGYSAAAVIDMMRKRADRLGVSIMSPTSLKTKLSSWEMDMSRSVCRSTNGCSVRSTAGPTKSWGSRQSQKTTSWTSCAGGWHVRAPSTPS